MHLQPMAGERQPKRAIHPDVRIGHIHLKVSDLERALAFYCGILGFELMQRYGAQAAFISAGGYHHHIGLNTWESLGGSPPPRGSTGLFHTAILYPTRSAMADALRRLSTAGIQLDGASARGQRGPLPARSRRERCRALLGQAAATMAADPGWPAGHGHPQARHQQPAEGTGVIGVVGAVRRLSSTLQERARLLSRAKDASGLS